MKRLAPAAKDKDKLYRLDELLKAETEKAHTHKLLLAVQSRNPSELDYRFCGGTDSSNTTPQDAFFIDGITQLMTSTIIFQLVDEDQIELEQRISAYLPHELRDNLHVFQDQDYSLEVRVHELLNQTSGIADYLADKNEEGGDYYNGDYKSLWDDLIQGHDTAWSTLEAVQMAQKITPKFEPSAGGGSKAYYSNTNFQLLGAIIEFVTKQSLQENFQSRIFDKLQLSSNTYLYDNHQNKNKNNNSQQQQPPLQFYYKDQELTIPQAMTSMGADGGVVSTLDDLLLFLRAYFDGQLFHPDHHDFIIQSSKQQQWNTINFPIQYGMGLMRFKMPRWMTLFLFDSPELLGHSGQTNASFAFYAPKEGLYVVGSFSQMDQPTRPFQFMLQVIACLK